MKIDGSNLLMHDPTHEVQALGLTPAEVRSRRRRASRGVQTSRAASAATRPRPAVGRKNSHPRGKAESNAHQAHSREEDPPQEPAPAEAEEAVVERLQAAVDRLLADLLEMGMDPPSAPPCGAGAGASPAPADPAAVPQHFPGPASLAVDVLV